MGMPLHDQMELYNEILSHVDHEINCTWFGSNKENVAIVCDTCDLILIDADMPNNEENGNA